MVMCLIVMLRLLQLLCLNNYVLYPKLKYLCYMKFLNKFQILLFQKLLKFTKPTVSCSTGTQESTPRHMLKQVDE